MDPTSKTGGNSKRASKKRKAATPLEDVDQVEEVRVFIIRAYCIANRKYLYEWKLMITVTDVSHPPKRRQRVETARKSRALANF